ncbi:hypothetical protein [Gloeothece verrucosa]|uniref:hypothetical protein n=1 Tax=Gloeothece verrucosa TaxID=2546359 RepID=UPI00017E2BC3|nr:hypothetical protein [Gloeothece verrucosa]
MNAGFFIQGLIIGLSIAAPVGPIGILCINRTLAQGTATGLVSPVGCGYSRWDLWWCGGVFLDYNHRGC